MDFIATTGDWIVALGKTIIHSVWMGLLILAILKLTLNVIPDRFSNLRYSISVLSILLLLGSVIALFFLLYSPLDSILSSPELSGDGQFLLGRIRGYANDSEFFNYHIIYLISCYIYFAGIPVVVIRSLSLFRYQVVMKKSGAPVPGSWEEKFDQLKISLGIKRSVKLMESGIITVPALVGYIKPVILVPAGMLSNLSVSQVETILMHELYHLRRFDAIANMIQLLIENIFFYNPAVWAISNIIRTEREKCCDDRVLDSCGDPLNYARALYQIAGQNTHFSHLAPGAGGTDKFQLFHRIQRILKIDTMKNNIREKISSILLLIGGVVIMLTITSFTSGFSIVKSNEFRHMETVSHSPKTTPPPASVLDTIPEVAPVETPADPSEAEVDWDEIKGEMEEARIEAIQAIEEIDWDEIKMEMEEARIEAIQAIEEIDWDEIKEEMEMARAAALEEIDWDKIKKEMSGLRLHLDSVLKDMDFDFDFENLEMDTDIDFDNLEVDIDMEFDNLEMEMDSIRVAVEF